jgi:hypothetical protein
MSSITKNELVTVTYKNGTIEIKGQSYTVTGKLTSSELMKVYFGNEGKGSARVTMDVPDEPKKVQLKPATKKKTVEQIITDLAEKGLDEDQIMKTEIELL